MYIPTELWTLIFSYRPLSSYFMHDWLVFFSSNCKNQIVHHAFSQTFHLLWHDYITLLSVMKCPVCNDLHFHIHHPCKVPIVPNTETYNNRHAYDESRQRYAFLYLNRDQIDWHQLAELIRLNEHSQFAPMPIPQQILYFKFILEINGLEWRDNSKLCKALLNCSISIHEVLVKLKRARYLRQYTTYYKHLNVQNMDFETEKKPLITKILQKETLLQEYPPYFPFEVGIYSKIWIQRQTFYRARYQSQQWSKEKLIEELLRPFII